MKFGAATASLGMNLVDATEQSPMDYFHFGLVFLGILVGAAGVVTVHVVVAVIGLVLLLMGLAYFWIE